jgi:hypothetical protein
VRRALAEKLYQWDSQLEAILLGYERAKLRVQQEPGAAEGPRHIITLKEKFLTSTITFIIGIFLLDKSDRYGTGTYRRH